jgi:hypothetical protein
LSFKIEQGVPAPCTASNLRQGRKLKYPFADLKVGDSFLVPETKDVRKRADQVKSVASSFGRRHGVKLATQVVDGGIRVWRLA